MEVIVEATGLEMEGLNFYRKQKLSEFVESEVDKSRLIKVGMCYINLASISHP